MRHSGAARRAWRRWVTAAVVWGLLAATFVQHTEWLYPFTLARRRTPAAKRHQERFGIRSGGISSLKKSGGLARPARDDAVVERGRRSCAPTRDWPHVPLVM